MTAIDHVHTKLSNLTRRKNLVCARIDDKKVDHGRSKTPKDII